MKHLTGKDYRVMPWANGRGSTVEMLRHDNADGSLRYRLSMAAVVEDGPFSHFARVKRNLTVISGPGFDLTGDLDLRADPLVPVAFPGDVALGARGVTGACEDFNVMVGPGLDWPLVAVLPAGAIPTLTGKLVCLFALRPVQVGAACLQTHDLIVASGALAIDGRVAAESLIAVQIG